MTSTQTTNNVDLVVDVGPNPLAGQTGSHKFWLNNNNNWAASIVSATVEVRDPTLAELDLTVGGGSTRVRNCTGSVGHIGAWKASRPITTGLVPKPGTTRTAEIVDTICTFSRTSINPMVPPARVYPLQVSTLVHH